MASQSTFLCGCGEVLGRMNKGMGWLPWNTGKGDPKMKGIECAQCGQNYLWIKPESSHQWVDVQPCCSDFMCKCKPICP